MNRHPRTKRIRIVPTQSFLSAFIKQYDGIIPPQDKVNQFFRDSTFTYMACCALPSYNLRTNQIENGISCAGCELALQAEFIAGPWAKDVRDIVYSRSGFLEHFVWCEQAQALWLDSNGGTVEPSRLPDMCKKDGFFPPRI